MSIYEAMCDDRFRAAALDFHAHELKIAAATEQISRAMHKADMERLEELRDMTENQIVLRFADLDRKEYAKIVNKVDREERIEKHWDWDTARKKIPGAIFLLLLFAYRHRIGY